MNLFRNRQIPPRTPQTYPSGTALKTEKGYFYVKGNKRYRIPSERVLASWNFHRVAPSSEVAAGNYEIAFTKLGFRDGTLIHNLADGKIYLVAENKRRHITSPDVLSRLGANTKDVLSVSATEITLQEEGEPLE